MQLLEGERLFLEATPAVCGAPFTPTLLRATSGTPRPSRPGCRRAAAETILGQLEEHCKQVDTAGGEGVHVGGYSRRRKNACRRIQHVVKNYKQMGMAQ